MKDAAATEKRSYRQGARAEAAEATAVRIMEAFLNRAETQWFDEITLDSLAQDAGVTVQTVIRRFGGKDGVVDSASDLFGRGVMNRRQVKTGDILKAVDALSRDYEECGALVMRVLSQEDRYPVLKRVADYGRVGHREWLAGMFAQWLTPLTPKAREARLDALVAATDLYLWRLVRVDMGRDVPAYKKLVLNLIAGALDGAKPWEKSK
ncbi:MAG: TetR/AcrR family transcriptional regulator [Caulobacterales bacterium]